MVSLLPVPGQWGTLFQKKNRAERNQGRHSTVNFWLPQVPVDPLKSPPQNNSFDLYLFVHCWKLRSFQRLVLYHWTKSQHFFKIMLCQVFWSPQYLWSPLVAAYDLRTIRGCVYVAVTSTTPRGSLRDAVTSRSKARLLCSPHSVHLPT